MTALLRILGRTFKRFAEDDCWTSAIVISYFGLMCAVPLAALFTFVTGKLLGRPELALRSLNIFTEEFFAELNPAFFQKVEAMSRGVGRLGLPAIIGLVAVGGFLFSRLIAALNRIFRAPRGRSFLYKRLKEYAVMLLAGVFLMLSLAITVLWSTLHQTLSQGMLFSRHLNPRFLPLTNNIFLQYFLPFALTLAVFFCLFKLIPEVKVRFRAAFIGALAGAVLWEIFKRIFAFYVAHLSVLGILLSRLLEGTLASIIFFLMWISFSLIILFWAAELAAALNERTRNPMESGAHA
ncbi:MAG: YihY/virulence factor BrkB family protein [Candidatus Aminicenantes bacterium]|nr:YihY/virulence factor BrkB family protein [Candidatus Aminicenantes bacterium]